jgi:hypothetical protein
MKSHNSNNNPEVKHLEQEVLAMIVTPIIASASQYDGLRRLSECRILEFTRGERSWVYKTAMAKVERAIAVRQGKLGFVSSAAKRANLLFEKLNFPQQSITPWMYALGFIDIQEAQRMLRLSRSRYGTSGEIISTPKHPSFLSRFIEIFNGHKT